MITRFYLPLLSTHVKHPKFGCHVTSLCQGLRRSAGSGGEDPENQVAVDCGAVNINDVNATLLHPSMLISSHQCLPRYYQKFKQKQQDIAYLKLLSFASTICSCPSGCVSLQETWYRNTSTTLMRSPLRAGKRQQLLHYCWRQIFSTGKGRELMKTALDK